MFDLAPCYALQISEKTSVNLSKLEGKYEKMLGEMIKVVTSGYYKVELFLMSYNGKTYIEFFFKGNGAYYFIDNAEQCLRQILLTTIQRINGYDISVSDTLFSAVIYEELDLPTILNALKEE